MTGAGILLLGAVSMVALLWGVALLLRRGGPASVTIRGRAVPVARVAEAVAGIGTLLVVGAAGTAGLVERARGLQMGFTTDFVARTAEAVLVRDAFWRTAQDPTLPPESRARFRDLARQVEAQRTGSGGLFSPFPALLIAGTGERSLLTQTAEALAAAGWHYRLMSEEASLSPDQRQRAVTLADDYSRLCRELIKKKLNEGTADYQTATAGLRSSLSDLRRAIRDREALVQNLDLGIRILAAIEEFFRRLLVPTA